MSIEFTLWPACVKTHDFNSQVEAAARAGFSALAISPLTYKALRAEGWSNQRIRELPRQHGVRLNCYDGFTDWAPLRYSPDMPDAAKAIFDVSTDECLAICDALELSSICATAAFNVGDVSLAAMQDSFGEFTLCAEAAGVRVDLEFLPFWGIPDLETAWDILSASQRASSGILLDTWHFMRGSANFELLERLPAGAISSIQLADASANLEGADLFEDTLCYRRLPGEGDLPLTRIIESVQGMERVRSVGPEIYSLEIDQLCAADAARRAADACLRYGSWG